MIIKHVEVEGIPKLAWLLELDTDKPELTLHHGSWVEADEAFFVEGAWEGDFAEKGIRRAHTLMGSGGIVEDGNLFICCPAHTSEGLFSIQKNSRLYFSNSIPFLLTGADEKLDINYADYERDMLSISEGLSRYKRTIPTETGAPIHLHYFCNLKVAMDGTIEAVDKETVPPFRDFDDYHRFLTSTLGKINDNAQHKLRKVRYEPIVFTSNGYDSTLCAALGKDIGCRTAVVYESKKSYKEDTGKPIVEALGYETIIEREELDYRHHDADHEFVAAGELGTSIFFASAEQELEGKFLLSGQHGGKVWGLKLASNDDLKRSFFPDIAKKEFRLRVGFLNILIPFFGVMNHRSIFAISQSEEMLPWKLGTNYDRPIPRRIVEQKGVPRELFGITKSGGAGSSLRFAGLGYLKKVMSPGSFEEFSAFYIQNWSRRKFMPGRHIRYLLYCGDIFLTMRNITVLEKMFKISGWDKAYKCSPWAPSYLFLWSTEKLKAVYGAGLAETGVSSEPAFKRSGADADKRDTAAG
ncbi:hypothetical protein [Indiicoccus explosivorum]|uniref:hypothetical protein n=1 Tax=Indiicoccus explosivorum TaxID=1917864 RepID=UPI000B43164B|nr:hypothetical protein [Indiicoccus explosivorum]